MATEYPTWPQTIQPTRAPGVGLRVATLVLGAGLSGFVLMQLGQLTRFNAFMPAHPNVLGEGGTVLLLLLIALAAVWGAPLLAAGFFTGASALAAHLGSTTYYRDMSVWALIIAALAVLCVIDWARRRPDRANSRGR